MPRRAPRRLPNALATALAVLCVLTLAACGGGGGSPTPSSAPSAPEGKPITLGFSAWPGWFPWQVAQEKGLFAKNGVNVNLKYFDSYTDSLNALSSGVIDANSQTLNDTVASLSGGANLKIVLTNDNSTGNDKIIAKPGINSIADLRGATVAVEQGTVDHYLIELALAQAGLTDKDIKLVPMLTDAAAAAFVSGQVDAVGVFAPSTTIALQRQGSRAIATSAEFPGAIPDHLVVTAAMTKDRPKDVQALVNTWFDTLKWIKDNHDEAVAIMAKRGGVSTADYATYDTGTTIFTLQQNIDAFTAGTTPDHLNYQANKIADFLVSTGLAAKKPSLDGVLDSTYVNAAAKATGQ